ncbi:hypothetical protein ACV357_32680, partial [Pseudomonas aeruginosa]
LVSSFCLGLLFYRLILTFPFFFLSFCQVPLLLALSYVHGSSVVLFVALFMFAFFSQLTLTDAIFAHFVVPPLQALVFALRYFLLLGASAAAIPLIADLEPLQGLRGLYLVLVGYAALAPNDRKYRRAKT